MDPIVGIDLGTTFSAVSFLRDGRPEILPKGSERITPSAVGFGTEGNLLVGTAALNQYVLHPERTVRSIKRQMGTSETVNLNGRDYSPTEISAMILQEMKRIAEVQLGTPVHRAVITVPAYFSDAARQATRDAGELAGFTVERILNEPTAAALAYGLDRAGEQQLIAVYDLGGGTFDVSIVEMNMGVLEVRASHGDTHLGGDDFDEALMDDLAQRFIAEHGLDPREDPRARARLLRAAENAKIALSSQPFAQVREEYLLEKDGNPLHLDVEIERREFEELIYDRLNGTLTSFDQALADAGVKAADLDHIVFVGGSTRIPLVWNMVAVHAGREPMNEINPDEAVALGAAAQAGIIAGEPIDAILVDVTPHTLGIAIADVRYGQVVPDLFGPIIHRNTALPTRQAQIYSTLHPSQTAIEVKVYQGESTVASENTLLGEFLFDDLKPEVAGDLARITVEFDLDLNGILHVSAKDRGSAQVRQTTLRAAHVRMSPAAAEAATQHLSELAAAAAGTSDGEDPLLARAREVLQRSEGDVSELRRVVEAIDVARAIGNTAELVSRTEELIDLLYDLGEE